MTEPKNHYEGHRDRLRQKFLETPEALADYEVLELLLFYCVPRKDTKPLAKDLLQRLDGFSNVLTASPEILAESEGLPRTGPALLKIVAEAARRLARREVLNRPVLSSWDKLLDYCHIGMAHLDREEFHLLFLDRKNVLIVDEIQQRGTIDQTPVYPREVVKRALALKASALIMVHNHPSGDPKPSKADIDMTRQVQDALRPVGIVLHDHLIIGKTGHTSFKSQGLL